MKNEITPFNIKTWLADETGSLPSAEEARLAEEDLIAYALAHALPPPPALRASILDKIGRLQAHKLAAMPLDPSCLPWIDESSNWLDWEQAVAGIEPPAHFDNIHLHTLVADGKRELFVAWVQQHVEQEVHHDLLESFLLLDGTCECHITDEAGQSRIVRMGPGDFITMNLGETHHIVVTSPVPTKAILQWAKLAA